MRVATAQEMARIDRQTIAGGVPGLELMERAGREIVRALLELYGELAPPAPIAVCCGKGNNGGDGLVIGRLLHDLGFDVRVMLLAPPGEMSADARANHDRLPPDVTCATAPPASWATRWHDLAQGAALAIDAVFGTGIKPPVKEPYASLLETFNRLDVPVLSVDIPSGVDGDDGRVDPVAVRAEATITVGLPKLGLLLPPGRDHVGELVVVDIGFDGETIARHTPARSYLEAADYAALLPDRSSDTHKYRTGTVLIIAGSRSFGGAAVLSGLGALRSGAGLVTLAVPEVLEVPVRVGLPEALIRAMAMTARGTLAPLSAEEQESLLARKNALAIGPGLDTAPATDGFVVDWLPRLELPLVVDADGLTAFARREATPSFATDQVILTPHAGELGKLTDLDPGEVLARRFELVPELARRWGVTLLLKGSPTLVSDPRGELTINPSGDDGLAHGGTGDVLTGLLAGLLAQGLRADRAAVLGAYLHGKAGENAAQLGSRRSVMAREVADGLPDGFADLEDLARAAGGSAPAAGAG